MFNRRHVIGVAAAIAALATGTATFAQDWKAQYPELVIAAVPDENASGMIERYTPFVNYLSEELGVTVTLRVANDYAAVIEGQKAGNIHIAQYGPASYARAYMIGAEITPFGMQVNADGGKGYHSVLYVKAESDVTDIMQLEGKNLCLVDPNSTSGNNVPRFAMDKMGINPEQFFGNVVYAGSHENAVIGLEQGTCDAAFNWWNDENESNLLRMDRKGMANAADFRIIFTSDKIVNSPVAYLNELPEELKAEIRGAFFEVNERNPEAFATLTNGNALPWEPTSHQEYVPIVELNQFVDRLSRQTN